MPFVKFVTDYSLHNIDTHIDAKNGDVIEVDAARAVYLQSVLVAEIVLPSTISQAKVTQQSQSFAQHQAQKNKLKEKDADK